MYVYAFRLCVRIFQTLFTGPLPTVDNYFLLADGSMRNIYQVDATSGATAQLLPVGAASQPIALAYDSTAKLLYWTDIDVHSVNRYSLLTASNTVIYRDPLDLGKCEHPVCFIIGLYRYRVFTTYIGLHNSFIHLFIFV